MREKCFEVGAIQAFLDGETTPEMSVRLTDHVASCDGCARLMAEAEEENSIVFSTLGRELDTLVPTQRLWSRINETLEVENGRVPVWQKVVGYVRFSLLSPSIAAVAGLVLILGIVGILTLRNTTSDVTFVTPGPAAVQDAPGQTTVPTNSTGEGNVVPTEPKNASPSFVQSNLPPNELRNLVRARDKMSDRNVRAQHADLRTVESGGYLPGEESYVRTIADLRQNVDSQKDTVLTPSNRVSYERDMAVVNDSIKRMREVARKNPRNQAARQVLYASYQDKIDLLNSVAQREELMASLR